MCYNINVLCHKCTVSVSRVLVELFCFSFGNRLQQGFYSPIKAIVSLVVGRVCHTSEACFLQTNSVTNLSKTSEHKYCTRLPFRKVYHWSSHVKTEKRPNYPTSLTFVHNIYTALCVSQRTMMDHNSAIVSLPQTVSSFLDTLVGIL